MNKLATNEHVAVVVAGHNGDVGGGGGVDDGDVWGQGCPWCCESLDVQHSMFAMRSCRFMCGSGDCNAFNVSVPI